MKTKNYTIDEMIENFQSMSATELKQIEKNSEFIFQNKGEYPETDLMLDDFDNKMDTLKEIITYCEKLKIPFDRFIPELYNNNMITR